MTDYNPDNWVILKINDDDPHYRVLAGWSGDGDSWCMNSRITRAEDTDDRFNFYGSSGSCYSCHKESYTLRMNNAPIWAKLQPRWAFKNDQTRFDSRDQAGIKFSYMSVSVSPFWERYSEGDLNNRTLNVFGTYFEYDL